MTLNIWGKLLSKKIIRFWWQLVWENNTEFLDIKIKISILKRWFCYNYTNEVEHNLFSCKYGAFYDTNGMKDLEFKYIATENEFMKIELIKNGKAIDQVYMLKKWFEFEK